MTTITCIANNGNNGEAEVPFYLCPCAVCTRMEWDIRYEEDETLAEHRHANFPECWDEDGRARPQRPVLPIRTAVITTDEAHRVAAFLPGNYSVVSHVDGIVTIAGTDNAGWTMDGYVLPRLASACLFGTEVV